MLKQAGTPLSPYGRCGNWVRAVNVSLLMVAGAHPALGLVHERGYGGPVGLLGKRLLFTTWAVVRPGQPDWQVDQGKTWHRMPGSRSASGKNVVRPSPLSETVRRSAVPHRLRWIRQPCGVQMPIQVNGLWMMFGS